MNIQDWFPLGLIGWISLQSKGLSRVFSNTTVQKQQFLDTQPSLRSNNHTHMWHWKTTALIIWTFVGKVMSLLFNTLSGIIIGFLPRSKHLLITWLQLPYAVILEPKKIKSATFSIVSPSICHEVMGTDAMIYVLQFTNAEETEAVQFYENLLEPSRTNTRKRDPSHYKGLECTGKKSRDTWSNRKVWPWSTKWSRVKASRVLPKGHSGHTKHPLPITQETTLHMDITRWPISKSDWLCSLQPKIEKLSTVSKNKTRSCGADHDLLIAIFRLKLKKVGKTRSNSGMT